MNNIWYRVQKKTYNNFLPSARRQDNLIMQKKKLNYWLNKYLGSSIPPDLKNDKLEIRQELLLNTMYLYMLTKARSDLGYKYERLSDFDDIYMQLAPSRNKKVTDKTKALVNVFSEKFHSEVDTAMTTLGNIGIARDCARFQHFNLQNGNISPTFFLDIGDDLDILRSKFVTENDDKYNVITFDMQKYSELYDGEVQIQNDDGTLSEPFDLLAGRGVWFFDYQYEEFKNIEFMVEQHGGLLFMPYDCNILMQNKIATMIPLEEYLHGTQTVPVSHHRGGQQS
ncbi:hypothetical protein FACS1894200_06320 [Spirochaetia bacterium]|nr:hypothetical protein FACS1894200_06320 [Spirochaetia bacterium]